MPVKRKVIYCLIAQKEVSFLRNSSSVLYFNSTSKAYIIHSVSIAIMQHAL